MPIRPAHLLLCGAVLLGAATAACGGDDKGADTKGDATTTTVADGTGTTAAGSTAAKNSDLVKFCADSAAFVKDAGAAVEARDQAKLDGLRATGTELSTRAQALAPTLDQRDYPEFLACQKQMSDAIAKFASAYATTG